MLPFLKNKKEASVAVSDDHKLRKPDDEADSYDVMHSAAQDLIDAIHSKNVKATAQALRAAFELAESEPHEEYEAE